MSAAGYLVKEGYDVTIYEKNAWVGGRAQVLSKNGYRFDMGPSWYLLWEEHEKWFRDMGKNRVDYYAIHKLSPQYKVYFENIAYTMPSTLQEVEALFESIEVGAGAKLKEYLVAAKFKHDISIEQFIYVNMNNTADLTRFLQPKILKSLSKLDLFSSYQSIVHKYFRHPHLRAMLEYPTVFLGSSAKNLPAIYTLMNWVDFGQGAFYPEGGFGNVVESMAQVVKEKGVNIKLNQEVDKILVENGQGVGVIINGQLHSADLVVSNADYHYTETKMLEKEYQSLSEQKFDTLHLAPSTLNFYIGIDKEVPGLEHHTFFFDADWAENFRDVYTSKQFNKKPLFYLHVPSKTDPTTSPKGKTAIFILIPIAAGLPDTQDTRDWYYQHVLERIEAKLGVDLRSHIEFVQSYSSSDYTRDYYAFKGNAFGLGQTLNQTAMFRPPNRSAKVKNLYYVGQYTIPGTGTSMAMIGGKVVSQRILREDKG